jgi:hypothetical protein
MKVAEEVGFHFHWAVEAEFEANGRASVSFLEFFFNSEEEIVSFFFVNIEFAVAGDAGGPSSDDFGSWENFIDEVADEIGEEDKLFLGGVLGGQGNEARNSSWDLNKGMSGRFLVAWFRIKNHEVDRFIQELREGVAGVDCEGGEDRENIAEEHFVSPGDSFFSDRFYGA